MRKTNQLGRVALATIPLLVVGGLVLESSGCAQALPLRHAQPNNYLASRLDSVLRRAPAPSAFLFASNDTIIIHKGYGTLTGGRTVTTATLFPIASISKQFTAAAILKLREEQKLKLEDTLGKFFPAVPGEKRRITIHQLLTHTSGLSKDVINYHDEFTRDQVVDLILKSEMLSPPGEAHDYSNAGYNLLAVIVEIASGERFHDYLRTRLFQPAGMRSTGYPGSRFQGRPLVEGHGLDGGPPYSGSPMDEPAIRGWYRRGSGGLLSTPEDLFRWQRALRAGKILALTSLDLLFKPHVPASADPRIRYGYGWAITSGTPGGILIGHNGGWYSYYCDLNIYPEREAVAIGCTSRRKVARNDPFDAVWKQATTLLVGGSNTD